MGFDTKIKEQIFPILEEYGYKIAESSKNVLQFESSEIQINIIHNKYEESFLVEIGKKNKLLYPLSNEAIGSILGFPLPLENVSLDIFIKNLGHFLKEKAGKEILNGNITILSNFIKEESLIYTIDIVEKQILSKAENAWNKKDYQLFLECINQLDISKIPQSYLLKYNLAKKAIKKE